MKDKLRMESKDMVDENIKKIGELFPNCITETKDAQGKLKRSIKWDVLKEALSGEYVEGGERYEFMWPGKKAAYAEAMRPIRKTLRPCKEESKNWDTTENLYIEGDNLEVLKLLQESYLGKVKMIYIDPPYNTGHDFVYRDNFQRSQQEENAQMGLFDEDESMLFENTESNGRFHSDWCSMIYSRLMLARNLLAEDGVVFISIDDNEVGNLRKICDEVFGIENFLSQIGVIVKTEGRQYGNFAKTHEYVAVYAKNIDTVVLNEVSIPNGEFRYFDDIGGFNTIGLRNRAVRMFNSNNRPNLRYPFYVDCKNRDAYGFSKVSTVPQEGWTEVWPSVVDGLKSVWRWGRETSEKNKDELVASTGSDSEIRIFKKDRDLKTLPKTVWFEKEYNSIVGTREVAELVGKGLFDFPKPLMLLKRICEIGTLRDSIVLDFFSGSATTAHAVMQLNAEDGGHRKFIMVQLPEKCDEKSEAFKAGYKNICEIGKERIRRAGEKIVAELKSKQAKETAPSLFSTTEHTERLTPSQNTQKETLNASVCSVSAEGGICDFSDKNAPIQNLPDIGFRVLKVADSNMKDVYYAAGDYTQDLLTQMESNIKEDRTDLDLLFGCLLDWGLPLSCPYTSEKIEGCTVHTYNNGDLIACFDANIPESVIRVLAKRKPLRAVFRDTSFASSPEKINVFEIFKLYAPDTSVKVI